MHNIVARLDTNVGVPVMTCAVRRRIAHSPALLVRDFGGVQTRMPLSRMQNKCCCRFDFMAMSHLVQTVQNRATMHVNAFPSLRGTASEVN